VEPRRDVSPFTGPLLGLIGSSFRAGRKARPEPDSEGVEDIVALVLPNQGSQLRRDAVILGRRVVLMYLESFLRRKAGSPLADSGGAWQL
jgi:hypothetical protein